MAGNLGKRRSGSSYRKTKKPPAPSPHERAEHAGRVPQVGVPSGPRQTVAPSPGSLAAEANLPIAPSRGTPASRVHAVPRRRIRRQRRASRAAAYEQRVRERREAAPDFKPSKLLGRKTAGTPTTKELAKATAQGKLGVDEHGALTTPKVRVARKKVAQAKKIVRRSSNKAMQGLSPSERDAAVHARAAHREYPDIPTSVLMALTRQESGFDAGAVSSADAQGLTQFIPGTATSYGVQYGTGKREKRSQEVGAAHYLHDLGFARDPQSALSGYSGGYAASDYNNPILEGSADYKALDKPSLTKKQRGRIRKANKAARRAGIAPVGGAGAKQQQVNYLKTFGKQVAKELRLVKAGKYDQGPGTLVVGDSDVKTGHEPEIAARLKLLSARIGQPVYVISGHRTPQHSVEVGGFADDPHTESLAADIGIGSALRDSAGSISEADYNAVGLHRPYYPASAAEINHVELLNGGTPATGGGASSATGVVGTPTGLPSGAVSSFAAATGQSQKAVRQRLKKGKLSPAQILAKLNRLGVGVGTSDTAAAAKAPEKGAELTRLEREYGKAAV
jgi:hypothetical protein